VLNDPIIIHGSVEVISALRKHVFNDDVWPDFEKIQLNNGSGPTVEFRELRARQTIDIAGIDVTPIPVNHLVPTFGLLAQNEVAAVVFTSDTYCTDEIWEVAREAEHLKAVFVDVSFPNELGELAAASKHLTPELLAVELKKLKREVEVYAVHIKPTNRKEVIQQIAALGNPRVSVAEIDRVYEW
jgi:cAMP phosphodiesterase